MVTQVRITTQVALITGVAEVIDNTGKEYTVLFRDFGNQISVESMKGVVLGNAYYLMGSDRKPGTNTEKLIQRFIQNELN